MKWATSVSTSARLRDAAAEAISGIAEALAPDAPDVVFAFVSHREGLQELVDQHDRNFHHAVLLGCTADGVIGGGRELEGQVAVSLTAGVLPDVEIIPYQASSRRIGEMASDPSEWWRRLDVMPDKQPGFVILADPHSVDTGALLRGLDRAYPDCPKVGGMAGGGDGPGDVSLFADGRIVEQGAVIMALYGDVRIDALVAQGARPVGAPVTVTACTGHIARELDGRAAVDVLRDRLQAMSEADRELFLRAPQVGLGIDPVRSSRRTGDFLVRDLIGVDPNRGELGIGGNLANGVTLQLHVRDAAAASVELDHLLRRHARERRATSTQAALLFSCIGRGRSFYGEPDHDTRALFRNLGTVPTGGFFCNGEIGPIHARTWRHAYTSVFALFRPRGWS